MNEKFITCNYQGRLGNLMYEVAATLAAAWENNAIPAFPKHYHSYYMNIPAFKNYLLPIVGNFHQYSTELSFKDWPEDPQLQYKPIIIEQNTRLVGYFTSSLYFNKYRERIIEIFSTNQEYVNELHQSIERKYGGMELVSVHVRRTDYVTDYKWDLPLDYYVQAAKYFHNAVFVVFSDDPEWCKQNLTFMQPKVFVSDKDYLELLLMGKFDAHICANSTFSSMGIILGDPYMKKKVIAPKNWCPTLFNPNICDPHWIII